MIHSVLQPKLNTLLFVSIFRLKSLKAHIPHLNTPHLKTAKARTISNILHAFQGVRYYTRSTLDQEDVRVPSCPSRRSYMASVMASVFGICVLASLCNLCLASVDWNQYGINMEFVSWHQYGISIAYVFGICVLAIV